MFDCFIAILIAYHADHNNGEKQFKIRSEKRGNVPDDGKIKNAEFSQFQSEKSEEINFNRRKDQNRERQNKGYKYQNFTRGI